MKKLIIVLSAILLFANTQTYAQNVACHFGILGGLTNDWIGTNSDLKNNCLPGWHAGLALEIKLPMYFALQPGVQYEMGHSNVKVTSLDQSTSYNELQIHRISVPVTLQWGPDLGVIRPFLMATPLFNFNLGGQYKDQALGDGWYPAKEFLNPFQFGLGLGIGLELWKIQLGVRYNWVFGDWRKQSELNPFASNTAGTEGITFSAGFFF